MPTPLWGGVLIRGRGWMMLRWMHDELAPRIKASRVHERGIVPIDFTDRGLRHECHDIGRPFIKVT